MHKYTWTLSQKVSKNKMSLAFGSVFSIMWICFPFKNTTRQLPRRLSPSTPNLLLDESLSKQQRYPAHDVWNPWDLSTQSNWMIFSQKDPGKNMVKTLKNKIQCLISKTTWVLIVVKIQILLYVGNRQLVVKMGFYQTNKCQKTCQKWVRKLLSPAPIVWIIACMPVLCG